jgi:hypothetical protein
MKICSIIILLGLLAGGCKEKSNKFDVGAFFQRVKIQFKNFIDVTKNIETATSKYENNQVDQAPVILWAFLLNYLRDGLGSLDIECYDEDKDLVGIGIKERYLDLNGKETTLIEEYPVMVRLKSQTFPIGISLRVKIRNSDQRKSEQNWNDYIEKEGNNKLDFITSRMNFPDIWISLPDANKTEVEMYIYDKKGNRSNSTIVHMDR